MKKSDTNFTKLNSFILVSTFFFLWLAVYFEDRVEDIFAYTLIFSFGILHGSNDLKLLHTSPFNRRLGNGFFTISIYYLMFIGLSILFFHFFPDIALVWFILFSGYHFGEQHWISKIKELSVVAKVFFISYGLFILFLLFHAHWIEVSSIIQSITGFLPSFNYYSYPLWISAVVFVLSYLFLFKQKKASAAIVQEVFYLLVFYIIFNTASLIWAFAIYFVLWHSLPSLADQIKFLYGSVSKHNFIKYLKSSSIYWGISVLGLAVLFWTLKDSGETTFLPIFFSFLAAITFPHVVVISRLNGR
ncbi:MAG: Brp/Blh family beta-carotene 15,15'-dioxygenase [Saonia sp.]